MIPARQENTTCAPPCVDAAEIWLKSVYEKQSASLYRYALGLTCSVEDAQDAVQEVFGRVLRERQRFVEVRNVSGYLFRATRNACYSILRRRRRCQALHEAICLDLAAVCAPHAKPTSATIISIRGAFAELSIEQREVLVLKILNQMTFKEIAEMVGASINTVAGRYRYGIEKLRLSLEDAEPELRSAERAESAEAELHFALSLTLDYLRGRDMKPEITDTEFGSITVDGSKVDNDILIRLGGNVEKRKKKLSKAVYGTSHTISLDEAKHVYEDGADQLILGSGQNGMVSLSKDAAEYFKNKKCDVDLKPTPKAIKRWNRAKGQVIGLFHVTC